MDTDTKQITDASTGELDINTLVGNACVEIKKVFTNGLLGDGDTVLTYTICQNGSIIGTKEVTYRPDGTNNTGKSFTPDPVVIDEYSDLAESTGTGMLPRYDGNGAQYTYTVTESISPADTYGTTIK